MKQGRFIQATEEAWKSYASGTAGLAQAQTAHAKFSQDTGKLAIVIISFGVASVRITEGLEDAKRLNCEIGDLLRTLTNAQTDPFWAAAIEALAEIATGNQNSRILYETGLRLQDETALDIMYRLAAMMTSGPKDAFHITMCSFLRKIVPWLMDTTYYTVVVSFLCDYWRWAIEEFPVHFSTPPQTRRELETAFAIPGERGLKQGLRMIAERLGISLTEKYKEYFSGKSD